MFTEGIKMYKEKIIDLATGTETIRNYTSEEIAEVEKAIAESETIAAEIAQKALEKAEVLAQLGITEDQAKLLLS